MAPVSRYVALRAVYVDGNRRVNHRVLTLFALLCQEPVNEDVVMATFAKCQQAILMERMQRELALNDQRDKAKAVEEKLVSILKFL